MSLPPDTEALLPRHVEDETLLAYLDGELGAPDVALVAAHLEQCWRCRSRVGSLEASIHAFLDAREYLLPEDDNAGGAPDASFRRRLAAHAAADAPRSSVRAALDEWRLRVALRAGRIAPGPRLRLAATSTALAAVALVAAATWWSVPVSAAHVLARAEMHELIDVRTSARVVRSVVEVERVDRGTNAATRLAEIETHTDPASFAVQLNVRTGAGGLGQAVVWGRDATARQPFAGLFPAPLSRYFDLRQWAPGVDVAGYLRLVSDRGDDRVSAKRVGGLFEITHLFAPGHESGISEARLDVDAATWLPTRVRLFVSDSDGAFEWRFSRTTLAFRSRTAEDAQLFASARNQPVVTPGRGPAEGTTRVGASGGDVPRRPLPLSWESSQATDDEASIAEVLHELGADLGEEISVFPMSDGSLLVQGLVDTDARRQQLVAALQRVPSTRRVEIYLPEELRTGSELFAPPWRALAVAGVGAAPARNAPVVVGDASGRRIPLQEPLEAHFRQGLKARGTEPSPEALRQAVTAFSNTVVSQSRQALFHAWALYRLEQEFQASRAGALSASALATVAKIRQSHRASLSRIARELSASITPFVGARVESAGAVAVGDNAQAVLRVVTDADALVRELFTVSVVPADAAASLSRLSALLKRVGADGASVS